MQHKVHGRALPTLVIIDATPAGSYPPSHIFSRVIDFFSKIFFHFFIQAAGSFLD